MLNGVKFPCEIGERAERTSAVAIVEMREKRVVFKSVREYGSALMREFFENLQQALPIWTPAWPT